MKKTFDIALRFIFISVFLYAILMTGGFAELSSTAGIVNFSILGTVLCWLVLNLLKGVSSLLIAVYLLVSFGLGMLVNGKVDGSTVGLTSLFFSMYTLLGAAAVLSRGKVYYFFVRKLRFPLAGWVILILLLDIVYARSVLVGGFGAGLLTIEGVALFSGIVLGWLTKVTVMKGAAVAAPVSATKKKSAPSQRVARPSVKRTAKPSVKRVARPAAKAPAKAAAKSTVKPAKAASKVSILDAKLEALCAADTSKKDVEPAPKPVEEKKEDAPAAPAAPAVPATTETGKIVSSVDFS